MKKTTETFFLIFAAAVIAIILIGCDPKATGGKDAEPQAEKKYDNISFSDLDGNPVNVLEAAAGKPIYLAFFASWCKECPKEVPLINEIYRNYAEKGLIAMYGVAVGDQKKKAMDIISKHGIEYPVLLDSKSISPDEFGVIGLPFNLLLDAEGKIIYSGQTPPSEETLAGVIIE